MDIMENEHHLLRAAGELDKEALLTIFDHYAPKVYAHALRRCHDPVLADDIVGQVFEKFLDDVTTSNGLHNGLQSYFYQSASQYAEGRTNGKKKGLLRRFLDHIF